MINNRLNNIGDVLYFKTTPLWNLVSITSYADTINNITGTRTVDRQYRYSLDGVVYSDWYSTGIGFTQINLELNSKQTLVVEFRIERTGTDNTGYLEVVSINLNGTYSSNVPSYPIGNDTIIKDYLNADVDVFNLMCNITQKMYEYGIVPVYMERQEISNDLHVDEDYIDFWQSIVHLYASMYKYGIQFTVIYWRKELLCEFLKQRTIQFCDCSDIVLLQKLAKNYYDEIRQRGTIEIFRMKDIEYPIGRRYKWSTSIVPSGFILSPANPIYIDDVKYNEIDELPFGWIMLNGCLVAPDLNYYKIEIIDNSVLSSLVIDPEFNYDILDTLPRILCNIKTLLQPTHFSEIKRTYHGEYLRMICFCMNCDEFMFNVVNKQNRGWNINNSSPMYRGLRAHQNTSIIKGYENFSNEVWDLSYYPIIGSGISLESFLLLWNGLPDKFNANSPTGTLTHIPYQ